MIGGDCESMLCYLNDSTWTSGTASMLLAEEIAMAMRRGILILLSHEMTGIGGAGGAGRRAIQLILRL